MFSFSFNFSSLFLSLTFSINSSKLILFLLRVTIISSFSTCLSSSQISLYFAFNSFHFSSLFFFFFLLLIFFFFRYYLPSILFFQNHKSVISNILNLLMCIELDLLRESSFRYLRIFLREILEFHCYMLSGKI